jgi:DNA-binding transcriptional MerR regulator
MAATAPEIGAARDKEQATLDKAPDAFRTISEVADDLDVPQHVLRFWESRFTQIRPMKRAGGRRYYRADDVDLLRGIRQLLYGEGYTIRGVQRILKEHGVKFVQDVWQAGAAQPTHHPADDDAADVASSLDDAPEQGRGLRGLLPSLLGRDSESDIPAGRREPALDDSKVQPATRAPAAGLPREDLRKLQAALHELGECRRLLDAVLG